MTDDQTQPTSGHERETERLQLAGVVLIVVATVGARVVDKVTSASNWVVYGVEVIIVMTVLTVGSMVMGRIEGRPARDMTMRAFRKTKSDFKKRVARLYRR